jgi:hypothetical protein
MGAEAANTVRFRPVQPALSTSRTGPGYLDADPSDRWSVGNARSREEPEDGEEDDEEEEEEEEKKKDKGDDDEEDGEGYSVRVYPCVTTEG